MLKKLLTNLKHSPANFAHKLANLFLGKNEIDAELLANLETQLILADMGVDTVAEIMHNLKACANRHEITASAEVLPKLKTLMLRKLETAERELIVPSNVRPYVILVVGVNGAGKTTTIGKLAYRLKKSGKKVMLAAADTFRAAASEQLKIWAERSSIPIICQQPGADSAAVAYDAVQAAKARGIEVLIIDTAGRLHTQQNLMQELQKMRRVLNKIDSTIPHEILLTLDASIGQNAVNQAGEFYAALAITGLVLTKLDGTARGGTVLSIQQKFKLPIYFIGLGENIEDLEPFKAKDFIEAIFNYASI